LEIFPYCDSAEEDRSGIEGLGLGFFGLPLDAAEYFLTRPSGFGKAPGLELQVVLRRRAQVPLDLSSALRSSI